MLSIFRTIGLLLIHLLVSTLGVTLCAAAGFYMLKPVLPGLVSEHSLKTDAPLILPFFPIESAVAVASGFAIARSQFRFGKSMTADLVWIIPLAWLLIALWGSSHNSTVLESSWKNFFVNNDPESKRNQLIFTLPFLTSLFYGIGHYSGMRLRSLVRHIDQNSV